MRFPWRPVGMWPDSARPWPLDCAKLAMGWRDMRKVFSTPFLDQLDAARGLALVVEVVVAAERSALERGERRIVGDAEERGQDGLAEHLGEGLALLVSALALALEAVAEDLVEEDGRGASAENCRAAEGLGDWSHAQRLQIFRHLDGLVGNGLLVGQAGCGFGLEGLDSEEIHAVGGACPRHNDQSRHMAGRGHARALGGDEVVGLVGRLKLDLVCKYVGKLREEAGDLAQALLPRSAVDDQRRRGREAGPSVAVPR